MASENKKRKSLLIALLILLLIFLIIGAAFIIKYALGKGDGDVSSTIGSSSSPSSSDVTSSDTSEEPSSSEATKPSSKPSSSEEPSSSVATKPSSKPSSSESSSSEAPPVKTDPDEVLQKALEKLGKLKGNSKEVSNVSNPATLTVEVKDTAAASAAATEILNTIKTKLKYNESTANGNEAVGNPNPFSYDYTLTFTEAKDGKYVFTFEYRFHQYYNVEDKGYDTNDFVEAVASYLEGKGKQRFDYQTTSGIRETQSVIILLEDDYATALEKAKGQVSSVCGSYRNFDFEYRALTIAGKEQKTALLYYIYCK